MTSSVLLLYIAKHMQPVEVALTESGYLQFSAETGERCFPQDALVITREDDALLLWPVRGAEGGGLLVKRRNAAGDRSVLIAEMLPDDVIPGVKTAYWDELRKLLRITFKSLAETEVAPSESWRIPKDCLGINSLVVHEQGRWVVYLEFGYWEEDCDGPLRMERRRIADYPTEQRALIAAEWMRRGADRNNFFRGPA